MAQYELHVYGLGPKGEVFPLPLVMVERPESIPALLEQAIQENRSKLPKRTMDIVANLRWSEEDVDYCASLRRFVGEV